MKYLIYYPFIYSLILVLLGTIHALRKDKKVWLILSMLVSFLITGLTVHFLIANLGNKVGFDKFDTRFLMYGAYLSFLVILGGIVMWRINKSWFPGLLIVFLAIGHVVVSFLFKLYVIR